MWIATLAIAGIPPFAGFFSKDEILGRGVRARGAACPVFYVFYGMGVLAALLTAFYMTRIMAMTFLGQNRTGEKERGHLHEAPWIMTGPLVVLGVLSLVGGVLNLPHLRRRARGARALARAGDGAGASPRATWSCPRARPSTCSSAPPSPSECSACSLGFRATLARPIPTARQAPAETGFARVLNRKYYVDELYDAVIVRPVVWLSRVVLWKGVDQG